MKNKTLKQLIIDHNNNYDFDIKKVINLNFVTLPSLSVIIPYWENSSTINLLLKNLYNGLDKIKSINQKWDFEVIIIDDGSKNNPAKKIIKKTKYKNIKILKNKQNKGRVYARNKGLKNATKELILFMDADILVDETLILNHLKTHAFAKKNKKQIITVGFFDFETNLDIWKKKCIIKANDIMLNDFRIDCVYHKTWIGCDNDKQFIGKHFKVLKQTDMFKKWPKGYLGPWLLPNMVLGGFFIVNNKQAKKVNGFDIKFIGYGFTETSLPTKLIAKYNTFVVPIPYKGCVHINDKKISLTKIKKDKIFRKKHDLYFNNYLNSTLKEVI